MSTAASKRGTKRKATSDATKAAKKPATKVARKPKGMPNFSPGEILVDLVKKQWKLGDLIGWGGFGALYYASPDIGENVNDKATFVAKVEPHSNGPLFGELHFYQRVAKEDILKAWINSKKLKSLGVPTYIGAGSYEKGDKKYRFMIMERFGEDVDQLFAKCSKCFHVQTVLTLGIRIINILEYIHNQDYVHADIKGSNLMMGYVSAKKGQVYLVDYGLAYRFNSGGVHKEYKEDPKRRHDGTIEFTSRDAHKGLAPSRRTDLEILGYVMLQWLCGRLPWEDNLADKNYVMSSKIKYMDDIPQLLKECLEGQKSDELEQYLKYVVKLDYDQKPDYDKIRKIFQDGLRKGEMADDGKTVKFLPGKPASNQLSNGYSEEESGEDALKIVTDQEESDCASPVKRQKTASKPAKTVRKPAKAVRSPEKAVRKPARAVRSPAKRATSRKTAESASESPKKTTAKPGEKRAGKSDEKPAKKARGRPRKTVMVDTATSP